MKKKIVCFLMTCILSLNILPVSFAAAPTDDTAATISGESWRTICTHILQAQERALSNLEKQANTISSQNSYSDLSTDELLALYIEKVDDPDNDSECDYIETMLNSRGTILLTDEELNFLFPEPQIFVHNESQKTRSPSTTYPIETSTNINIWSATMRGSTSDGYYYAILTATPRKSVAGAQSSLYHSEVGLDIFEDTVRGLGSHYLSVLGDTLESTFRSLKLAPIAAIIGAITAADTDNVVYSINYTAETTAKFCWIYDEDFDAYYLMGVSHSSEITLDHHFDVPGTINDKDDSEVLLATCNNFSTNKLVNKAVAKFKQSSFNNPYLEAYSALYINCTKDSSGEDVETAVMVTVPYATNHWGVY